MHKRVFAVALLVVLAALPAVAQEHYGTVEGTVLTEGTALPGVIVTLSGPLMQGVKTMGTDANGKFRFVPVPPGSGYTLTAELDGFQKYVREGLIANVGRSTELNIDLSVSAVEETIQVTTEQIVLDTSKSTIDTAVEFELMDALASNRTFQSVMELAPGVEVNANNPQVHGAADTDNLYLIDGVDTSDPRTQTWGSQINFDTIQEVQVQTAGYAAEYGRVTGGVVNLVTKSGGNEFHGLLRYVRNDKDWASDPKEGRTSATLPEEDRPSLTFGGPIMKDRLWFFGSYESRDRVTSFGRAADSNNDPDDYVQDVTTYDGYYASMKLTLQVTPSHSVVGYYNSDPIDISNAWGAYYLGAGVDPRSEATQEQGGQTWNLQWFGVLSPKLFVEARYGSYDGIINLSPQGPLGPEPTFYDLDTGYYSGTTLELYQSDRTRDNLAASVNYYLDTAAGNHRFKAGVEWLEVSNSVLDVYYPSGGPLGRGDFVFTTGGSNYLRYSNINRDGVLESTTPYIALYLQDSWSWNRLSLNLGLRAESISLENDAGDEVVDFGFGDQIAPRLGIAYDLNGDSIHASVSRFYDIVSDYVTAGLQPSTEEQELYAWGPLFCDFYGEFCDEPGWVLLDRYAIKANNFVDSDLDPTYTDEITLGYSKRLTDKVAVSANYIWRRQEDAIEDIDAGILGDAHADDGQNFYTNAPGTWAKYQAVEVSLKKLLAADRIQFISSYTYAFEHEGFVSGSAGAFASQLGGYADASAQVVNRYGETDTDHLFKFDGSYSFPWNMTTGLSGYYYSGSVYTPFRARGPAGNEFVAPAGSREVGGIYQIDFHIEQAFRFGGRFEVALYGDVFNLTDTQEPLSRSARCPLTASCESSTTFGRATSWQTPRRFQLGAKFEF